MSGKPALAALLAAAALCVAITNTLLDQYAAREQLTRTQAALAPKVQQYEKVEVQLDALATGTIKIAQSGNPLALEVLQVLKASGISLRVTPAVKKESTAPVSD